MGANHGVIVDPSISNIDIYKQIQSRFLVRPHPLYPNQSEFKLLHEKLTNKKYVLRIISTSLEKQKNQVQEMINKRLASKNQPNYGLIKLEYFILQNVQHICNTTPETRFYLIFEIEGSSTFREEILKQGKSRSAFCEQQLLKGMQNLVNGLLWVRFFKETHGNINTKNIYWLNSKLILSDPLLCPSTLQSKGKYPSQQKLRATSFQAQNFDPYESDLFSISMCILQAISIHYLDSIYRTNNTLSHALLNQQINTCNHQKLRNLLQHLLLPQNNQQRTSYLDHFHQTIPSNHSISFPSDSKCSKTLKIHVLGGKSFKNNDQQAFEHSKLRDDQRNMNAQNQQALEHTIKNSIIDDPHNYMHIPPPNLKHHHQNASKMASLSRVNSEMTIRKLVNGQAVVPSQLHLFSSQPDSTSPHGIYPQHHPTPKTNQYHQHIQPNPIIQYFPHSKQPYPNPIPQYQQTTQFPYSKPQQQERILLPKQTVSLKHKKNELIKQSYNEGHILKSKQSNLQQKVVNALVESKHQCNNFNQHSLINYHKPQYHNFNQFSLMNASHKDSHQLISPVTYLSLKQIELPKNIKHPLFVDHTYKHPSHHTPYHTLNLPSYNFPRSLNPSIEDHQISLVKKTKQSSIKSYMDMLVMEGSSALNGYENGYLNDYEMKESILMKERESDKPFSSDQLSNDFTRSFNHQYIVKANETPQKASPQPTTQHQLLATNKTIPQVEHEEQESYEDQRWNIEQYKTVVEQNGSRYEGFYRNGMRNGYGTFYYRDGGIYEGEWKDNLMHGYGKLFYQKQKLAYDGYWQKDQFDGKGRVFNDNYEYLEGAFDYTNIQSSERYWTQYDGTLAHDLKEGHGKLKLSNNEYYYGHFQKDLPHGKGLFYSLKDGMINGTWSEGKLINKI